MTELSVTWYCAFSSSPKAESRVTNYISVINRSHQVLKDISYLDRFGHIRNAQTLGVEIA